MRGIPGYNEAEFARAAKLLRSQGWIVHNPVEMDKQDGDFEPGLTVQEQERRSTPETCRKFAGRDIDVIVNILRAEDGDAIVLLPGWRSSVGATAEFQVARWVGLRWILLGDPDTDGLLVQAGSDE